MDKRDVSLIADFGCKLKEQREKMGLSIDKAAKRCGIASSYYNYLERGMRSGVSLMTAVKVAEAMGLTFTIAIKS